MRSTLRVITALAIGLACSAAMASEKKYLPYKEGESLRLWAYCLDTDKGREGLEKVKVALKEQDSDKYISVILQEDIECNDHRLSGAPPISLLVVSSHESIVSDNGKNCFTILKVQDSKGTTGWTWLKCKGFERVHPKDKPPLPSGHLEVAPPASRPYRDDAQQAGVDWRSDHDTASEADGNRHSTIRHPDERPSRADGVDSAQHLSRHGLGLG